MAARWVIRLSGVLYAAGVVLLALGVWFDLPGLLAAYGDPGAWWPIALNLAFAAVGVAVWLRAGRKRLLIPVLLALAIVTVVLLAPTAYARCPDPGQNPVVGVATRVIGLLTNNYAIDMFGKNGCELGGVPPLALQFARLVQLVGVLAAATAALGLLLRTQLERGRVGNAPRVALAVGVDEESSGLLAALGGSRAGFPHAVLTQDTAAPWVETARNAGWVVVAGDPSDRELLFKLLARGRGHALRDLYVFSSPGLGAAKQLQTVMASLPANEARDPVRALLRMDNRWQAEKWRSRGFDVEGRVFIDTVGRYDAAAGALLDDVRTRGADTLVLHGHSDFTLAVLAALAQDERDQQLLGSRRLDVVLAGPGAADAGTEAGLLSRGAGRSAYPVRVAERDDLVEVVARTPEPAAVVFTEVGGDDQRAAAVLSGTHPGLLVYVPYAGAVGVEPEPLFGSVRAFGTSLELTDSAALNRWTRLASGIHAAFVARYPDPKNPARRPWAELSDFYKASNIRLVTSTVASAVAAGRSWQATSTRPADPLSDAEVEAMARAEHESWFHFMRSNGWRRGRARGRAWLRNRHPDLRPWAELPEASRAKNRDAVTNTVSQLDTMGYRSFVDPDAWHTFRRRGEVSAVRRDEGWEWTTADGTRLRGRAGDWEVTDDDGASRSVAAAVFERTHEHVRGDRWRRVGEVRAREARPGEVVHTLEGDLTARPGQWLVRGVADEEWLVSEAHLAASYDKMGS